MPNATVVVDCDEGRRMGCATFCCRLIVRYDPDKRPLADDGLTRKNCVDKDPADGLCVHLNKTTHRCEIWEDRPSACRAFDCNQSRLLQVVLQYGWTNLIDLVRADADLEDLVQVPVIQVT